jgi:4-hydroxybutyryl-CoA dehydratase/vinylacetyl-CoA-Delta-isomerase
MITAEQYRESMKAMSFNAYALGEKLDRPAEHPLIIPAQNAVAATYELGQDDSCAGLGDCRSHLTGNRISRFTNILRSCDDLLNKVKMQRVLGQRTGTCFQRCVGMDAINAISSTTYEMDAELGTEYNQRFLNFLEHIQDNDLVSDGAMTDPKGDRSKRPYEQDQPDVYLHVTEKLADGIVVRGAKLHQTGALNSHEIIVMPTMAMREEDTDFAVSFAVPADSKGITYVLGRQPSDTRKMEPGTVDQGNVVYGGQECLVIFEDVFVPWERVFMCGEYQFAGKLVERFAGYHRQSYGGCKVGVGDVLIGAVSTLMDYHGLSKVSHLKDKLVEMIHLNETLYCCGVACSAEGKTTPSGTYEIDHLLANVCKLNVTRFPYEIARLAEDIAGGLMVTMPSEFDLRNPEIGPHLRTLFSGVNGINTECRMRMLRLVENLTIGSGAVGYRTESMHGAGPPQAMRIMIARQADLEHKKSLAKNLAGIGSCVEEACKPNK